MRLVLILSILFLAACAHKPVKEARTKSQPKQDKQMLYSDCMATAASKYPTLHQNQLEAHCTQMAKIQSQPHVYAPGAPDESDGTVDVYDSTGNYVGFGEIEP